MVERNLAKVDVAGSSPVSRSGPVACKAMGLVVGGEVGKWERWNIEILQVVNFPFFPISHFAFSMAPYPSGKGEVCKTFMRRFESARRLNNGKVDEWKVGKAEMRK